MKKAITIAEKEEYLRQVSVPVDIEKDNELDKNIKELEMYCEENEVMAMAAVQLEIPKRLIYLKNTNLERINKIQTDSLSEEEKNYNEARVVINPVILNREGLTEYWEACASCLNNCGRVLRSYKMEIEYIDRNGKKQNEIFEGFEATVLSHEMDHLNGILHMDIAEEVLVMTTEERKKWRQTHNYKIYSKTGNYEKLKKESSKKE